MNGNDTVTLNRDVEASVIPVGTRVTLQEGESARITQSLGDTFTVLVNGNLFRMDGKDADALGREPAGRCPKSARATGGPVTPEQVEKEIWEQLRSCYDPEIPVNIGIWA